MPDSPGVTYRQFGCGLGLVATSLAYLPTVVDGSQTGSGLDTSADSSESACVQLYQSDRKRWLQFTGGNLDHVPPEHVGRAPIPGQDQGSFRVHQNEVALGCHAMGGTLWEVHWSESIGFPACAPANCTQEEVAGGPGRDYLLGVSASARALYGEDVASVNLRIGAKLGAWSWLPLDFAISGIAGCGTTSLFRNLLQHSQIAFTTTFPDEALYRRNLLPTMDYIEQLQEMKRQGAASGRKLLGIDNPVDFDTRSVLAVYSCIPNFKIIAITCDPVRSFERNWWTNYVKGDSQFFTFSDQADMKVDPEMVALFNGRMHKDRDSGHFTEADWLLLAKRAVRSQGGSLFSGQLRQMADVVDDRFLAVHQSHLRSSPRAVFRYLLERLGVEDFPESKHFNKHNTWDGKRLFCTNRTMVRRLQHLFRHDYETIRELVAASGLPTNAEIRDGLSYCQTTSWECGSQYSSMNSTWDAVSGGSLMPEPSFSKLGNVLQLAQELAEACSNRGGRFWSVHVTRLNKDAGVIGICAPRVCTSEEAAIGITHRYLRTRETVDFPRPFVPLPEPDFTELKVVTRNEARLWSSAMPGNLSLLSFLEVNMNLVTKLATEAEVVFVDLNDAPEPVTEILPSPSTVEWVRRRVQDSGSSEPRLLALGLPNGWGTGGGIMVLADASWLQSRSGIAKVLNSQDFQDL